MKKSDEQLKDAIIEQFEKVALYLEALGENQFKIRAYQKAAEALEGTEVELVDIASNQAKVPGVGEGIRHSIQEFLETGKCKILVEVQSKVPAPVLELMQVPALSPKKAMQIHTELGVNTIGELAYACQENRLSALKGFGEASQKKILNSIEEYRGNLGKCRLDDALELAESLRLKFKKSLGESIEFMSVGEMGRHLEIVSQLEFLIEGAESSDLEKIPGVHFKSAEPVTVLEKKGFRVECTLLHSRPALFWVFKEKIDSQAIQWLCAPPEIRELIEKETKRFKNWEPAWLESIWIEQDRKPNEKTYRLARHGKVRGFFHCHTNFSDGVHTLEQMVRQAEKEGYEYIGVSDHSQSAYYARGLVTEKVREQAEMVRELQKKVSIRIFHGVESDILIDGNLDYDEELLASLDFVISSIHSRFQMDEEAMTSRLVKALSNPLTTFWGHPTGRLLLGRKPYALDWKRCLSAAKENNVAVEINCHPHRLDIDWRMGAELEKLNLKISLNPDAHSMDGVGDVQYGMMMAEKAMVSCDQILNLKPVAEMEKYLWERKKQARL